MEDHTLNSNLLVNNHKLDMTTPSLKPIMHWSRLILAHIVKDPQSALLLIRPQSPVQPTRDHLVRPVLERQ